MGTFDGVHSGHRALIASARRLADERGLPLVAVTFSPRPERLIAPAQALPDLCSIPTRIALLRDAGADDVVVVPFTKVVARISAERFARLLVEDLGLTALCVGEDFALGRERAGDVTTLRTFGLEVVAVPCVPAADGRKVSSSTLRAAIADAGARLAA
jgi:riboflavin kinase/FMN adenylyltransferase